MNNKLKQAISSIALVIVITFIIMPLPAEGASTLKDIVCKFKDNLVALGAALSTIAFIVSGLMFLSATAKPERMAIAKGSLVAAIIGIAIILLAGVATDFVANLFGLTPGTGC